MTRQPVPMPTRRRAESLRGLCGGSVHLPGDQLYDMARSPWNLQACHFPAAVVYPAFPDEVAEVLGAATAAGLQVAPQGTGHGAPPLQGRLAEAVLLRTSAMTELRVDPVRRTARAGAGVLWGDLVTAAGEHGLAALHPSSPDVGVVGYSLGGGIGWYARRLGLQCNTLTAIELVLADGTFVRATADADTELFWALRGGAAPLGVITALEFPLIPLDTVVAGFLAWDWTAVERVLPAWVAWCADAPDAATTSFRLVDMSDDDALPAPVRGRRLAVIDGAVLGDDAGSPSSTGMSTSRNDVVAASGAVAHQATQAGSTRSTSVQLQARKPAITVSSGNSGNSSAVTTPSGTAPPRSAQNSSASVSAVARTNVPSASTSSIAVNVLVCRPSRRAYQPIPPPSE